MQGIYPSDARAAPRTRTNTIRRKKQHHPSHSAECGRCGVGPRSLRVPVLLNMIRGTAGGPVRRADPARGAAVWGWCAVAPEGVWEARARRAEARGVAAGSCYEFRRFSLSFCKSASDRRPSPHPVAVSSARSITPPTA